MLKNYFLKRFLLVVTSFLITTVTFAQITVNGSESNEAGESVTGKSTTGIGISAKSVMTTGEKVSKSESVKFPVINVGDTES